VVSDARGVEVSDFIGEYAVSDSFVSAAMKIVPGMGRKDHALKVVSV
jgi:hypothetical protein